MEQSVPGHKVTNRVDKQILFKDYYLDIRYDSKETCQVLSLDYTYMTCFSHGGT
jgi:predicted RNA-binding protein associated with RNAse of E/G family